MADSLTYPAYENRSGWNLMLEKSPYKNPLSQLEKQYDYIIIGAGFTGFACAIRLAELAPQKRILIIEATEVGEGASGRNSGFLISASHKRRYTGEDQVMQSKIYADGFSWLQETIQRLNIDCEWSKWPKIDASATPSGVELLKKRAQEYHALGITCTELSKKALYDKTGSDYYLFGLEVHNNTFIQPAKLMRGYADNLPENVTLIESTPVIRLEKGAPIQVITRNVTLLANSVILANNGFVKKLGFLRDRLVTIYTYAGITPTLDEAMINAHGSDLEWGIIPAHRLGTTLRRLKNNRFMVRSEYSYEAPIPQHQADQILKECYRHRYPDLKSHELEFLWGGVTALTLNNESYFGKLPDTNIYISAGCNGAGGIKGSTHGKLLAEMATRNLSPELIWLLQSKKPSYLPPEPFRRIGAEIAIRYQRRKAGLER